MIKSKEQIFVGYFLSPIGNLTITSNGFSITSILFPDKESIKITENSDRIILKCITQFSEYFEGKRVVFDLPLLPQGTEFQNRVWSEVLSIPFGETSTYGLISKQLGDSNLSRAVGMANGANPIPIIIPCHRVIGNNGRLTGYAGGLDRKKWLLNHEQTHYKITKGQLNLF